MLYWQQWRDTCKTMLTCVFFDQKMLLLPYHELKKKQKQKTSYSWDIFSFIFYLQIRFLSLLQLRLRYRVKSFIASFIFWSMNCKWIEFCHIWWKITPRNRSTTFPFCFSSGHSEWQIKSLLQKQHVKHKKVCSYLYFKPEKKMETRFSFLAWEIP